MALIRYSYPFTGLASYGVSRSPWRGLESEINRLFDSTSAYGGSNWQFPVNVTEDKDNTYVRAELPGVAREDLTVQLVEDALTISAVRKQKVGEKEESFASSRSVAVAERVQADKVSAAYVNGVLTVTLPKREETKPRQITVS